MYTARRAPRHCVCVCAEGDKHYLHSLGLSGNCLLCLESVTIGNVLIRGLGHVIIVVIVFPIESCV